MGVLVMVVTWRRRKYNDGGAIILVQLTSHGAKKQNGLTDPGSLQRDSNNHQVTQIHTRTILNWKVVFRSTFNKNDDIDDSDNPPKTMTTLVVRGRD